LLLKNPSTLTLKFSGTFELFPEISTTAVSAGLRLTVTDLEPVFPVGETTSTVYQYVRFCIISFGAMSKIADFASVSTMKLHGFKYAEPRVAMTHDQKKLKSRVVV